MKKLFLICNVAILSCFVACSSTDVAQTKVGSAIIAKVGNSAADKGLRAAADKIGNQNPYLYSVAQGLRASEGQLVTKETIQTIVSHYGDPANQHRFKQLGTDIWNAMVKAAGKITWNTLEAAAVALESPVVPSPTPTPTVSP